MVQVKADLCCSPSSWSNIEARRRIKSCMCLFAICSSDVHEKNDLRFTDLGERERAKSGVGSPAVNAGALSVQQGSGV